MSATFQSPIKYSETPMAKAAHATPKNNLVGLF